jgi:hypothetical protein
MSSNSYNGKDKKLSDVRVIPAEKAWVKGKGAEKPNTLNPAFEFIGKVDMDLPNFVLKANRTDKKTGYVEDVQQLNQRTKRDLVDHFYNKQGKRTKYRVAYLVRTDSKSKTAPEARAALKPKRPKGK